MSSNGALTSSLGFTKAIFVCPRCQIDNLYQITNSEPEAHVCFLIDRLFQHSCKGEVICKL